MLIEIYSFQFILTVSLQLLPFVCLISAKYLHVCRKSDPNLSGCMVKSIETLRPYLVKGIPEIDVPSIDPMILGDLIVSESTQSNGLRLSAKNVRSFGSSLFKLKKIE